MTNAQILYSCMILHLNWLTTGKGNLSTTFCFALKQSAIFVRFIYDVNQVRTASGIAAQPNVGYLFLKVGSDSGANWAKNLWMSFIEIYNFHNRMPLQSHDNIILSQNNRKYVVIRNSKSIQLQRSNTVGMQDLKRHILYSRSRFNSSGKHMLLNQYYSFSFITSTVN